jgi:cardiolipin synthase
MMCAVELLAGAPAFMRRLEDRAETCRDRLWVQFSTFEGDTSGTALADVLMARAKEGVDVRFLVDHYSDVIANDILPFMAHRRSELQAERQRTAALLGRMTDAGVRIVRTAPVGRFRQHLLYRDHRKIVVIDDRAFVGGLNVSDHNFAWRDFMVELDGPIVADVAADFDATWSGTPGTPAPHPGSGDVVITHAPGHEAIATEAIQMIDGARSTVRIESPSLLGDDIEGALARAASRGVAVDAVVPARHNRLIFRVWRRAMLRRLARAGVTVHRYDGSGGMTHAKALVVDDERATFGSFNFFELESMTQKELNVFTSDPKLVRELAQFLDDDRRLSHVEAPPKTVFGHASYRFARDVVARRTRALLRDSRWRAVYA